MMREEVSTNDATDYVIFYNNIETEHGSNEEIKKKLDPMAKGDILLVFVLCICQFIVIMGFSILPVFFPTEALHRGLNLVEVGYIFSSYYFGSLLFAPLAGILITKISIKKVMIFSLIAYTGLLLAFSFTDYLSTPGSFLSICIVLRILQGFGVIVIQVSAFAIVGHRFQNRLGKITGLLEMSTGIAFAVGSALGGIIYQYGGYGAPFYFLFALSIAATILCWICTPDDCTTIDEGPPFREAFLLMKHPLIYFAITPAMVLFVQQSFFSTFYSPFMANVVHTSDTIIGIAFAANSVVYAISTAPIGSLVDRGMVRSVLMVGFLVRGIGFLTISSKAITGIPPSLVNGLLGAAISGLGSVTILVPLYKYVYMQAMTPGVENNFRTSAAIATLLTTVQSFGMLIGPLIGGEIIGDRNYSLGFTSMAILIFSTTVIIFVDILRSNGLCMHKWRSSPSERAPLVINDDH